MSGICLWVCLQWRGVWCCVQVPVAGGLQAGLLCVEGLLWFLTQNSMTQQKERTRDALCACRHGCGGCRGSCL